MADENKTSIISMRSVVSNKKIRTIPTFLNMCKKMGADVVKKGDCFIVTSPESDVIKQYVEGKV